MYTITRGPSKLVTQRRTGPTQQLESKTNDFKHKQTTWSLPNIPAPKIVFNRPNGKKYHQPSLSLPMDPRQEWESAAAHEDNVKFVYEAWQEAIRHEQGNSRTTRSVAATAAVHYKDDTPTTHMNDFVPIDLDEWWAQRFLTNIDKLS
ncbi:MAPK regulated corepressor interacting protein 2-like isoform X1 [Syngnathus acus]|uniref:MAPK regulated corepressor interacting protein 2-like isoform X1 n=1 Tax=Syngnathus acus TaxID=161584 RepID=UPI001885B4D6|nr:MAPK regulated corepressor interacting protein 2-like isoform X1 [Syngnathus acus]